MSSLSPIASLPAGTLDSIQIGKMGETPIPSAGKCFQTEQRLIKIRVLSAHSLVRGKSDLEEAVMDCP